MVLINIYPCLVFTLLFSILVFNGIRVSFWMFPYLVIFHFFFGETFYVASFALKMMHCSMFSQFMIYPLISQFGAKSAVLTSKRLVYYWMHRLNMFIEFLDRIELWLWVRTGQTKQTWFKHKEAFSTLVECLYKWHTFISRIFLKIGWVTVSAE